MKWFVSKRLVGRLGERLVGGEGVGCGLVVGGDGVGGWMVGGCGLVVGGDGVGGCGCFD